jgi:hypothetical protein
MFSLEFSPPKAGKSAKMLWAIFSGVMEQQFLSVSLDSPWRSGRPTSTHAAKTKQQKTKEQRAFARCSPAYTLPEYFAKINR